MISSKTVIWDFYVTDAVRVTDTTTSTLKEYWQRLLSTVKVTSISKSIWKSFNTVLQRPVKSQLGIDN